MPKKVYSPKLKRRELFWVGTTLDDLRAFPEEVRLEMGHALHLAQIGDKAEQIDRAMRTSTGR